MIFSETEINNWVASPVLGMSAMKDEGPVLDLGRGYEELKPIFFGALGKLAHLGFVIPPADGLDLIHDFFADEWDNLKRTFDASKGDYKAYAYRAFVQFVRPKIVRMQRLQNFKVGPDEVETTMRELQARPQDLDFEIDRKVFRQQISRLPELQRRILLIYLSDDKVSERALAINFELSRYKLRECLVDALGRVLVDLDRPSSLSSTDWKVALALWKDARTVVEAAKCLGLTEHQVKLAYKKNRRFLIMVLANDPSHDVGENMMNGKMKVRSLQGAKTSVLDEPDPIILFRKVLISMGNYELLGELVRRAGEIVASLDSSEAIDFPDYELESIDPSWMAKVYEALVGDNLEPQDSKLFYAHSEAETEVGLAFDSLIQGLPAELADIAGRWLAHLPEVDKDELEDLLDRPSVQGALPISEAMARYGVTPLSVLESTDAISRLLERCLRTGRLISSEQGTRLSSGGIDDGKLITGAILIDEISLVTACPSLTARAMLDWSIRVAQFKPFLFDRFIAEPFTSVNEITLTYTSKSCDNLYERWGYSVVRQSSGVETEANIDVENEGTDSIVAADAAGDHIVGFTAEADIGSNYLGTVSRIVDFGAFVEIFPGTNGLLHISEIADRRVNAVRDELRVGQKIMVKCIRKDGSMIGLSCKAVLRKQGHSGKGTVEDLD